METLPEPVSSGLEELIAVVPLQDHLGEDRFDVGEPVGGEVLDLRYVAAPARV